MEFDSPDGLLPRGIGAKRNGRVKLNPPQAEGAMIPPAEGECGEGGHHQERPEAELTPAAFGGWGHGNKLHRLHRLGSF